MNYQILNAMGGLIITGPIAILAYLWVLLKSKPTANEKPPSTGLYVGVWFLSSFISGNIAQLIAFFLGYNFSSVFLERNPDVGAIIAIWATVISSSFLITFTCYKRFPRLNFKKVLPYFWVLGGIGILVAIGQISQTHKQQFYNKNDFNTVLFSIFAIGIGCLFILTSQLSKAENEKNTKGKLDPILKSQQAKSKSFNNPEPKPVVGAESFKKTVDQPVMLNPISNAHKKSTPEIDLEKDPNAASVTEHNTQAETLEIASKVNDVGAEGLSNSEARSIELSQASTVGEPDVIQQVNFSDFERAQTAIEYIPEVAAGWSEIENLPERFKLTFLRSIEVDTKQSIDALVSKLREEHYAVSNPYKTPELNSAFEEIKKFGDGAISEFRRVIDMLGEDIDVQHTVNLLQKKYFHPEKDMLQQAIENYSEAGIIEALHSMGFLIEVITDAYTKKISYKIRSENNSARVLHGIDALYDFARRQL